MIYYSLLFILCSYDQLVFASSRCFLDLCIDSTSEYISVDKYFNNGLSRYLYNPLDDNLISLVHDGSDLLWQAQSSDEYCTSVSVSTRDNEYKLASLLVHTSSEEKRLYYLKNGGKWSVIESGYYDIYHKLTSFVTFDISSEFRFGHMDQHQLSSTRSIAIYEVYDNYSVLEVVDNNFTIWKSDDLDHLCKFVTIHSFQDKPKLMLLEIECGNDTSYRYFEKIHSFEWTTISHEQYRARCTDLFNQKIFDISKDLSQIGSFKYKTPFGNEISVTNKGQFNPSTRVVEGGLLLWQQTSSDERCCGVCVYCRKGIFTLISLEINAVSGQEYRYYEKKDGIWLMITKSEYLDLSNSILDEIRLDINESDKVPFFIVDHELHGSSIVTYKPKFRRLMTEVVDGGVVIWSFTNYHQTPKLAIVHSKDSKPFLLQLEFQPGNSGTSIYYMKDDNGWVQIDSLYYYAWVSTLLTTFKLDISKDLSSLKSNIFLYKSDNSTISFSPLDTNFIDEVVDGEIPIWKGFAYYDECTHVILHLVDNKPKFMSLEIFSNEIYHFYYEKKDNSWVSITESCYKGLKSLTYCTFDISQPTKIDLMTTEESHLLDVPGKLYTPSVSVNIVHVVDGNLSIWSAGEKDSYCRSIVIRYHSNDPILVVLEIKQGGSVLFSHFEKSNGEWSSITPRQYSLKIFKLSNLCELDILNINKDLFNKFDITSFDTSHTVISPINEKSTMKIVEGDLTIWYSDSSSTYCKEAVLLSRNGKYRFASLFIVSGSHFRVLYFEKSNDIWIRISDAEYESKSLKFSNEFELDVSTRDHKKFEILSNNYDNSSTFVFKPKYKSGITKVTDGDLLVWKSDSIYEESTRVSLSLHDENYKLLSIFINVYNDKVYKGFEYSNGEYKEIPWHTFIRKLYIGLNGYNLDVAKSDYINIFDSRKVDIPGIDCMVYTPKFDRPLTSVSCNNSLIWNSMSKYEKCLFVSVHSKDNLPLFVHLYIQSSGSGYSTGSVYYQSLHGIWVPTDVSTFYKQLDNEDERMNKLTI